MTEDIEALKRDYRDLMAPRELRARIHAAVAAGSQRDRPRWLPAAGLVTAALALAWVLMLMPRQEAAIPAADTPSPSLSALASLTPTRPAGTAPSLARVKSVSLPAPPQRPAPSEPTTRLDTDPMEETDHA